MTYAAIANRPIAPSRPADAARIEELIQRHIPLVRRLAWHVHGRMSATVEPEELIQTGMVALIESARAFEDRGFEFATYASTRIKGAMIDQLRRSSRQTRAAAANRRAIEDARRRVENRLCRRATPVELAAELGVDMPEFYALERQADHVTEIDLDTAYSDEDMAFCDLGLIGESVIDDADRRTALAEAIGALPEREQMILQLYFFEELNLDEIGAVLNVGASRVCQIKKAALEKLQNALRTPDAG